MNLQRSVSKLGLVASATALVLLALAASPTSATNICSGSTCPSPLIENEDVPNSGVADIFTFTATAGVAFTIQADTVAADTAFDPWMRVCGGVGPVVGVPPKVMLTGCFAFADDNFGCTFPPPAYACPRASGVLPADPDGVYFIGLAAYPNGGSFAGTVGVYQLSISLGSYNAVTVTQLVADDRPGNLP